MNLHRFDVKSIPNVELRRKTFKTTQKYKSDQIAMNCIDFISNRSKQLKLQSDQITMSCIDLTSKRSKQLKTSKEIKLRWICIDLMSNRSKMLSYVAMHSKQHKTTKVIKLQCLASIWCQNIENYKSDQNTKTCIDFMSNRSKQLKTTKAIKLQCIASIWSQNDQKCWVTSQNIRKNAKLQKLSKYNDLHRFDVKTIKTTQNYESDQITMNCIDLMSKHWKQPKTKIVIILWWICIYLMSNRSKMLSYVEKHSKQPITKKVIILRWICIYLMSNRSKMLSYVEKHSKQPKTKKWSYYDEFASIWCQIDQKCWVTSQNTQNNPKLKSDHITMNLHLFDVKSIKNVELRRKTFKTTQKYKSDHITMNLHLFDVKSFKNVELRRKTLKTTQN